eukprot:CAMPEP_0175994240 /NCGR_PEP_ID=MMETSP0108-20121206/54456_1 /TAXON_ID=195067 ORGANISM="Goniomonas pacifica, Strain CCMP1869" /NCGR_SAMPLE_ID=MMETSP0108 /ASSEMBLY_ACC=CAM_ASM_000204 /LENGTH=72 /DNA_ID=CAMNT_0017326209 /DNA_START=144 /DNA_END=362 /DNA_ORIENTATION=+
MQLDAAPVPERSELKTRPTPALSRRRVASDVTTSPVSVYAGPPTSTPSPPAPNASVTSDGRFSGINSWCRGP